MSEKRRVDEFMIYGGINIESVFIKAMQSDMNQCSGFGS
jgi:hypothetical protein